MAANSLGAAIGRVCVSLCQRTGLEVQHSLTSIVAFVFQLGRLLSASGIKCAVVVWTVSCVCDPCVTFYSFPQGKRTGMMMASLSKET